MYLDHRFLHYLVQSSLMKKKWLQLVTCKHHNGGTKFRMIHFLTHLLCGNLSHPHDNRLDGSEPTLRGAKPKLWQFPQLPDIKSNRWLPRCWIVTTTEKKLNIKSDFLLSWKEYLFIRNGKAWNHKQHYWKVT